MLASIPELFSGTSQSWPSWSPRLRWGPLTSCPGISPPGLTSPSSPVMDILRNVWKCEYSQPHADTFIYPVIYPHILWPLLCTEEGSCLFPSWLYWLWCILLKSFDKLGFTFISYENTILSIEREKTKDYIRISFKCYPNNQSKTSSRRVWLWMKYSKRRKLKVSQKLEINEVNNQIVSGLQEIEDRSGLQGVGLAVSAVPDQIVVCCLINQVGTSAHTHTTCSEWAHPTQTPDNHIKYAPSINDLYSLQHGYNLHRRQSFGCRNGRDPDRGCVESFCLLVLMIIFSFPTIKPSIPSFSSLCPQFAVKLAVWWQQQTCVSGNGCPGQHIIGIMPPHFPRYPQFITLSVVPRNMGQISKLKQLLQIYLNSSNFPQFGLSA